MPQPIFRCFRRFDAHEYIWPQRGQTCSRGLTIGKRGASEKRGPLERDHGDRERIEPPSGEVTPVRSPELRRASLCSVCSVISVVFCLSGRASGHEMQASNATKVVSIHRSACLEQVGNGSSSERSVSQRDGALFEYRARKTARDERFMLPEVYFPNIEK